MSPEKPRFFGARWDGTSPLNVYVQRNMAHNIPEARPDDKAPDPDGAESLLRADAAGPSLPMSRRRGRNAEDRGFPRARGKENAGARAMVFTESVHGLAPTWILDGKAPVTNKFDAPRAPRRNSVKEGGGRIH